jgi:hypothetical protein
MKFVRYLTLLVAACMAIGAQVVETLAQQARP